jgi:hypothetical protein
MVEEDGTSAAGEIHGPRGRRSMRGTPLSLGNSKSFQSIRKGLHGGEKTLIYNYLLSPVLLQLHVAHAKSNRHGMPP